MAKRIMSRGGGIGESKVFADPQPPERNIADCHIEGKRIGDFMTEEQIAILPYRYTDEGFDEFNQGKERGLAREVSGPLDKSIQHRRDDLAQGMQPWEANDPMKALVDAHIEPGERPKFLSDAVVKKHGGSTRGFEIVKDDNGDPVRLGTLVLGKMPEGRARERNRHYQQQDRKAVQQIHDGSQLQYAKREERISGRDIGPAVDEDSPEASEVFAGEFGEQLNG